MSYHIIFLFQDALLAEVVRFHATVTMRMGCAPRTLGLAGVAVRMVLLKVSTGGVLDVRQVASHPFYHNSDSSIMASIVFIHNLHVLTMLVYNYRIFLTEKNKCFT